VKNKNKGFTFLEIIISIVVLGILVTITVPTLAGAFEKSRDAEKKSNVQKLARLILVDEAITDSSSYDYDSDSLKSLLTARGMPFPESNSLFCYVYGYAPGNFFFAIRSEENQDDYFVDGTFSGQTDFDTETIFKGEVRNCSPLTSPTAVGNYTVLYLQ